MKLKRKRLSRTFILGIILLSFISIILVGSIILALPFSHEGDGLNFFDAIFVSTSAISGTGIFPVNNISAHLNLFGEIILTLLIEIGGLGIVTFVMFGALIFKMRLSFSQRLVIKESWNQEHMGGIVSLLKKIIITALIIQLFGALICFIDFYFIHDMPIFDSIGQAIFHSISSFNTAGIDLFGSNSIIRFKDDVLLNLNTMFLILSGGIGFVVIFDIIEKRSFKKLSLHSKIVLTTTFALLLIGALLIKVFNWENITWLQAFFLSCSAKSTGYTTVSISTISDASALIVIILMFIGASPASTGGGIKTTAIFTVTSYFFTFAFGKNDNNAFNRKIPTQQVMKSFVLIMFSFTYIIVITVAILAIEGNKFSFLQILFETVSCFSVTGLTYGIAPSLSIISQIILVISMYIGRIGPITFISLLNQNIVETKQDDVRFVEENVIIG